MTRWKVTVYLDDTCQEHGSPEKCAEPPEWWIEDGNDPEDWEAGEECWHPTPFGEIETEQDARMWMNILLSYGDRSQDGSFIDRSIERVEE